MAVHLRPVQATVQEADLNASWRLLQRMYVGKELGLPMLVFGTEDLPMPTCFQQPNHPYTKDLIALINQTLVCRTTYATVEEWKLSAAQVDQLQMEDPRVKTLRQNLADDITLLQPVQELRAKRVQLVNNNS